MTLKEKAKELVFRFMKIDSDSEIFDGFKMGFFYAQRCALIAVDEIISSEPRYPSDVDWDDCGGTHHYYYEAQREEALKYWQQVKQEIEKL